MNAYTHKIEYVKRFRDGMYAAYKFHTSDIQQVECAQRLEAMGEMFDEATRKWFRIQNVVVTKLEG